MNRDEIKEKVKEIKAKRDRIERGGPNRGTVWYTNSFEEAGKITGPVEFRDLMGYEMVVIGRANGSETLLHLSDVERIDFAEFVSGPVSQD